MPQPTNIQWTKRIHKNEIELARELGVELKGALDGLRDLYCFRSCCLPNDNGFLSGCLGVSTQKMRALKNQLIDRGFLVLVGDQLQCDLAHKDYVEAATLIEQKRQAGRSSAKSRAKRDDETHRERGGAVPANGVRHAKLHKNNNVGEAGVEALLEPKTETNTKTIRDNSPSRGERLGSDGALQIGKVLRNSPTASVGRTLARGA